MFGRHTEGSSGVLSIRAGLSIAMVPIPDTKRPKVSNSTVTDVTLVLREMEFHLS